MTFLTPSLLGVLLPALAVPLLIHLLNKGWPHLFRFPSVELIKQTMAQRSRLHRWRHVILLLLRTAFLLLVLLAFLQPVHKRFGVDPTARGERQVLIVFDHSASMEHTGDGPSSRERAVHEARMLIDSLRPEDGVNLLLLEPNPSTCFVNFSHDHAEAKRFLALLKPGLGWGDVNQANAAAARLFSRKTPRPEIYYLSDFQRKNWANANFSALPPAAKLFFVDVGPTRRDNHAVLDARLSQSHLLAGDSLALELTVGNFSAQPFAGRLTVAADERFSVDQDVTVAPWSEAKLTVPVPAGAPGLHRCEVRLPPDALPADDRFCLTYTVADKEEVLVVTDGPADARSGAWFLKTALNPYADEAGALLPRSIPSGELSPNRMAGVDKIFMTQVSRLSGDAAAALAQFLFRGGGLVYFLDGAQDAGSLSALEHALGPNTVPLRLSQKRTATNVVAGAQQIVRGDFRSRYLQLFRGAARQDLSLLEFYDYYQGSATGAGTILLWYADESPALAVLHHGLGTALLLNFSAAEFSSNLARQRLFPAWIQDLVKALSTHEPLPAAHLVGEPLQAEFWRSELRDDDLRSPAGTTVKVRRELAGERYTLSFTPDQLGFYTLGRPQPIGAFAINTPPGESDLRPIDKEVLPREFAADRPAHFVGGQADFEELAKGRPLFHWFLLAGLLLLLTETAFQFLLQARRGTAIAGARRVRAAGA